MKYTIKAAMKSGKVDPQWGPEWRFQVEEADGDFKTNFKEDPKVGDTIYGTIEQGKFGPWFKRGKKDDGSASVAPPKKSEWAPENKAMREDGMKQGMCLNNAAAYVLELTKMAGKALDADEWADQVVYYATALYQKSDLQAQSVETTTEGNNVKELFS